MLVEMHFAEEKRKIACSMLLFCRINSISSVNAVKQRNSQSTKLAIELAIKEVFDICCFSYKIYFITGLNTVLFLLSYFRQRIAVTCEGIYEAISNLLSQFQSKKQLLKAKMFLLLQRIHSQQCLVQFFFSPLLCYHFSSLPLLRFLYFHCNRTALQNEDYSIT